MLLAGISSRVERALSDWDVQLDERHPDFRPAGLKTASVIRTGWLVTHPSSQELPYIGQVSEDTRKLVLDRIIAALMLAQGGP
jgi:hypothetical protein